MRLKRFKLVLFLYATAVVVCTLIGYVVLAQPVHAGSGEPTVRTSVDLHVEFPDIWPWDRAAGEGSWTVSLWRAPGS